MSDEVEVKEGKAAPAFDYKAPAAELRPVIEETVKAQIEALPGIEKGFPAVLKSAQLGAPTPKKDFYNWIRTGKSHIKAALQEGTTAEGGYLVPDDELGRIVAKRDEESLVARLGATTFNTDRDVFNIPTEGTSLTKFTIVAEEGALGDAGEETTVGQAAVTLYKIFKPIKVSEEPLEH